jgi:hypothetical protein
LCCSSTPCDPGLFYCGGACCAATIYDNCCGGACVNTQTDPLNCGACGNICLAGFPAGMTCCGGVCVNTQTDPTNCGTCGNACSGGGCIKGACCKVPGRVCAGDAECCAGTCVVSGFSLICSG